MFIRNNETLEKVVRRSVATGKVIGRRGTEEARRMAGHPALSQSLSQAEQRFLVARDICRQLAAAQ